MVESYVKNWINDIFQPWLRYVTILHVALHQFFLKDRSFLFLGVYAAPFKPLTISSFCL